MSKHFAEKIAQPKGSITDQVERAYYETMGHPSSRPDRDALAEFAREHGLTNLCRLLMNLNEFVFVD
jgi:hypothetical protein